MARGEIKIPMAVDTSGIAKEIDNGLVEPFEKAEDALKKLAKVDAGRDLERDLDKAQDATEDLAKELDDARDQLKKLGYAAKDAGDDAKKGMNRAEEGVEEFGDEARSTAKEAAASFDGSAESIVDAFQEVAANAFAGFGPAGLLAGLAVAAGIGIAVQEFQKAAEAAEELRLKAVEYASDAVEAGVSTETWITSAERLVDRIRELEETKSTDFRWFWEEDPSQLEEWTDAFEKTGGSAEDLNKILSASDDTLQDYRDSTQEARDALMEEAEALSESTALYDEAGQARIRAIEEQIAGQDTLLKYLDQEIDTREKAADSAERQKDAGVDAALARAEAEEHAAQVVETANQQIVDSYDTLRDSAADAATSQEGVFNIDQWIADVAAGKELLAQHAANVAVMSEDLTAQQLENFNSLPMEVQQQVAAAWASGDATLRNSISSTLTDAAAEGVTGTNVELEGIDKEIDVDVTVEADTSAAEDDIDAVANKKRTADINVKTTGKAAAKADLDALAKDRHATIRVRANTSEATNTVNTWRRNQESRPLVITVRTKNGGSQLL